MPRIQTVTVFCSETQFSRLAQRSDVIKIIGLDSSHTVDCTSKQLLHQPQWNQFSWHCLLLQKSIFYCINGPFHKHEHDTSTKQSNVKLEHAKKKIQAAKTGVSWRFQIENYYAGPTPSASAYLSNAKHLFLLTAVHYIIQVTIYSQTAFTAGLFFYCWARIKTRIAVSLFEGKHPNWYCEIGLFSWLGTKKYVVLPKCLMTYVRRDEPTLMIVFLFVFTSTKF